MRSDDLIRPFQLDKAGVRGRLVRLGPAVDEIITRHGYPAGVSNLVGEAVALSALLAGALKFEGVFSVQAKGDGPVRALVADFASPGRLRGYAQFDRDTLEGVLASRPDLGASVPRLLGGGYIAFTVDQGEETDRYQGIVALEGATLADCAHQYFRESEQLRTAIRLAAAPVEDGQGGRSWRAGGLMIQRLPEGDPALLARGYEADPEAGEDDWRRAVTLLATARDEELLNPGLEADGLLWRLYHEESVRVFEEVALDFGCRCSSARAERVLASLQREALVDLAVDGRFVVKCEFCSSEYVYPAERFLKTS
jgi:molecular chaperone Hsp33